MRTIRLFTILTATLSGVTAVDKIARSANGCIVYAVTTESWLKEGMTRRRVVYDTTKYVVHYDQTLYSIGWMWSNEVKGALQSRLLYLCTYVLSRTDVGYPNYASVLTVLLACKAQAKDTIVYYHGTVIPGGAYVVDSSEVQGAEGDRAHQCLLDVLRTTLANNLNCTK